MFMLKDEEAKICHNFKGTIADLWLRLPLIGSRMLLSFVSTLFHAVIIGKAVGQEFNLPFNMICCIHPCLLVNKDLVLEIAWQLYSDLLYEANFFSGRKLFILF